MTSNYLSAQRSILLAIQAIQLSPPQSNPLQPSPSQSSLAIQAIKPSLPQSTPLQPSPPWLFRQSSPVHPTCTSAQSSPTQSQPMHSNPVPVCRSPAQFIQLFFDGPATTLDNARLVIIKLTSFFVICFSSLSLFVRLDRA